METLKKWLDRTDQPDSFYELLGVPMLFDDRAALQTAVRTATRFLHQYQHHKSPAVVQRARSLQLLCAAAGHTISDDARWRDYDTGLIRRLQESYVTANPQVEFRTWLESAGVVPHRLDDIEQILRPPVADTSSAELPTEQYRPGSDAASVPIAPAESVAAVADDRPLTIENYQIMERLGSGGIGIVYKARHVKLQKLVAIKVLRSDKTLDAATVTRFHREMAAMGNLNHPNIVRATDAGSIRDSQYLVMDLVEGRNLHDLVQLRGPLPVSEVCDIVRQTSLGLQYAHDQGLIHRDIKPSNLMITTDGTVKILDLGLAMMSPSSDMSASVATGDSELTAVGVIVGTVDYMAPEQLNGREHVQARSDVYSLGCTMYYLLTGQAPFRDSGTSLLQRSVAHFNEPVPSLHRFRQDVPGSVESILQRMLAKNPAERFTASEVAAALSGQVGSPPDSMELTVETSDATPVDAPQSSPLPLKTPPLLPRRNGSPPRPPVPSPPARTAPPRSLTGPPGGPRKGPPPPPVVSGSPSATAITPQPPRQATLTRTIRRRGNGQAILWVTGALLIAAMLGTIVLISVRLLGNARNPDRHKQTGRAVVDVRGSPVIVRNS